MGTVKGIILAGGTGSRLHPLTLLTNKHLLPVYDRPMIYYAIDQLVGAGLDRIMIVTGGNDAGDFLRLLGNGAGFGLKHLDYAYQERPGGIGEALGLAEHYAGSDPVAVLLADNIFERSIRPTVDAFRQRPRGARIALAKMDDPRPYGVAVLDGDRLTAIVEKPATAPSCYAVTGLYLYDNDVFGLVRELRPSKRGELEITDINNQYLARGLLEYDVLQGYWADCGESMQALHRAGNLVAQRGANNP